MIPRTDLQSLFAAVDVALNEAFDGVEAVEASAAAAQSAAETAEANAKAALASFRAVYLGAQAADPSVDLNGDAVTAGALYFNSLVGSARFYNGSAWVDAPAGPPGPAGQGSSAGVYNTRTDAIAATVPASVDIVITGGYAVSGDMGGGMYRRSASEPGHPGKLQDASGAWWELVPGSRGVNVRQLGAVGNAATDDTASFHAARDVALATSRKLVIPRGQYVVSNLDFTDIQGFIVEGDGVNTSRLVPPGAPSGNWIDLAGSLQFVIRDLQIGYYNQPPGYATGLYLAQVPSNVSNQFYFENIYVSGSYSVAPLYIFGVPSSQAVNSDFYNYTSGPGAHASAWIEETPAAGLSSAHTTIATGTWNAGNWTFLGCEFHKFAGAGGDNGTIRLNGSCQAIGWASCVITGGATAYVFVAGGGVKENVFTACTFETESSPVTPMHVIYVGLGDSFDGALIKPHTIITSTPLGGPGVFTVD